RSAASVSAATVLIGAAAASSAPLARRRDLDERHPPAAADRVLRQPAIPAREVLLLDEDRRERRGDARVVGRLRIALEPRRLRGAPGLRAGGVALALGGGRSDLGLPLRLDQLVALLLGLLLFDLFGLDRPLVVRVEANIGQRGLFQLDPVLREPLRDAGLH